MFKKLIGFFKGEQTIEESIKASLEQDKSGKATDQDLHIATAVLLVHVASSDQSIAREEAEIICNVMERNLGIPEEEIPPLVEMAVSARREKGKIDEFVSIINERFDVEQRVLLLSMIWKVVLADQKLEKLEDRMVTQIRNRLRLGIEDDERARAMAEDDSE